MRIDGGGVAGYPGKAAWRRRRQPPLSVQTGVGMRGEQVRKLWAFGSAGSL